MSYTVPQAPGPGTVGWMQSAHLRNLHHLCAHPATSSPGTGFEKGCFSSAKGCIYPLCAPTVEQTTAEELALCCFPTLCPRCCVHTLPSPVAKPRRRSMCCPGAMAAHGKAGSPSTCQRGGGWQQRGMPSAPPGASPPERQRWSGQRR